MEEDSRKVLLGVWNLDYVPRTCGLWHEFLRIVDRYGGHLTHGGGVIFERFDVRMHINMPAVVFRHQMRSLQQIQLLALSRLELIGVPPDAKSHAITGNGHVERGQHLEAGLLPFPLSAKSAM